MSQKTFFLKFTMTKNQEKSSKKVFPTKKTTI